jgi:transposase
LVTPVVTVFRQGLSRSAAAAIELLGDGFAGTVVSDRFSAYNHLPLEQRQLCWAHLKRDLTAISERTDASAEFGAQLPQPRQQLFEHWHQWKAGATDWLALQRSCQPLRLAFEQTLQRVGELGCQKGERSPWGKTVAMVATKIDPNVQAALTHEPKWRQFKRLTSADDDSRLMGMLYRMVILARETAANWPFCLEITLDAKRFAFGRRCIAKIGFA